MHTHSTIGPSQRHAAKPNSAFSSSSPNSWIHPLKESVTDFSVRKIGTPAGLTKSCTVAHLQTAARNCTRRHAITLISELQWGIERACVPPVRTVSFIAANEPKDATLRRRAQTVGCGTDQPARARSGEARRRARARRHGSAAHRQPSVASARAHRSGSAFCLRSAGSQRVAAMGSDSGPFSGGQRLRWC